MPRLIPFSSPPRREIPFLIGMVFGLFTAGCGSPDSGSTTCIADPDSTVICVTQAQATDSGHAYQGVRALVGFYPTDQCTPGTEVMKLTYDLSQTCFGWRRQAGSSTRDNSATHFQCYRDRVCYTQHTQALTCSNTPTDKQFSTTGCTKDDAGDVWLKLLGGTEGCPAAPAGFACPLGNPGQGTPGKS